MKSPLKFYTYINQKYLHAVPPNYVKACQYYAIDMPPLQGLKNEKPCKIKSAGLLLYNSG
jgi:hypothetical protein